MSNRIKLIVIISLGLVLNSFVLKNFKTHKLIFTPTNKFIETLVDDIQSVTDNGDEIYLRGVPYYVYQFSNTLPPGKLFVYELPWYKKVLREKIDNNVIISKPNIIVIKITKHTNLSVSNFIKNNYQQIKSYNKVDMYIRK